MQSVFGDSKLQNCGWIGINLLRCAPRDLNHTTSAFLNINYQTYTFRARIGDKSAA